MGTVAKQSFFNSINSYIGVALGALNTMIFFPRVFAPEVYGEFQSLFALITIISTFAHLGFPTSVVVFFPKLDKKEQSALWSFMLTLISASSIFLALVLGLLQFLNLVQIPNASLGLLVCISIVYFELFSALSQYYSKVVFPQFVRNVFRRLIITAALGIAFLYGSDVDLFYSLFGLGYLIHLLLVLVYARPDLPKFKWQPSLVRVAHTLSYGLMVMLATGSLILVSRIDILMIRSLLGSKQVAFYFIAFFIGSVISVPVKSVIASIRPFVAKAWAREDLEEIHKLYKKSALTQMAITGFLFLVIWINLDLFTLVLEEEYRFEAFPVVVFLIGLSEIAKGATGINGMILTVSEKQRFNFYSGLVLLALTIIGNWILIPFYGLSGAAFASLAAILLFNLFKLFLVKRFYHILPGSKEFWIVLTVVTIAVLLVSLIRVQDWSLWFKLITGNLLAGLLLLVLFNYSKALDDFKVFKVFKATSKRN